MTLRADVLDKCLKSPVFEDAWKSNMVNRAKHCSNLNESTFAYLLINVKDFELEKVSLSNMRNLWTVCEQLTSCHKFSLFNRDKLAQPIQKQLSKNKKDLSQFFSPLLKCRKDFEYFLKKYEPHR